MHSRRSIILFTIVVYLSTSCNTNSLPEDYVTDNEEQLARLKRENFLDSILKHFSFFGSKSKPRQEGNLEEIKQDKPSGETENIAHVMSSTVSSSAYSSYETQSIEVSAFINATHRSSFINNISITQGASSLNYSTNVHSSSSVANASFLNSKLTNEVTVLQTISMTVSKSSVSSATTSVVSLSSSLISNYSHKTDAKTFVHFPVTSMMFSTMNIAAPPVPAPHSTPSNSDTAPLTSIPFSTVFSSSQPISASVLPQTEDLISHESKPLTTSLPILSTTIAELFSVSEDQRLMPVLPDENNFSKPDYVPPEIENAKGVGFVYINILLPILSGITGALLITFAIMLFRCCRRRKLKRVRYFGGTPKSDFVRLDRMNLLTDTSDEDEFD